MRQEWVGLKIPMDNEKSREDLPLQLPPSSRKLIVIICLGADLGVLTGARFVKALISRNLLPLWELGAAVGVGFSLPLPSYQPLPDSLSVTCVRLFLSSGTWSGAKGVFPVGTEHRLMKKRRWPWTDIGKGCPNQA